MDYLHDLLKSIKEEKLILFVGSGISVDPPSNLPSGGMVEKILKEKLQELDCFDRYKTDHSLEILNYNYLDHIWKGLTFEGILERAPDKSKVEKFLYFLYSRTNPNSLHLFIAELLHKGIIKFIISTNYDICIEEAYKQLTNRKLPAIFHRDHYLKERLHLSSPFIFKIHGSIKSPDLCKPNEGLDEGEIIYSLYQEGEGLIEWKRELLKEVISGKDIIFLGYSGYDFDICPILSKSIFSLENVYWSIREDEKIPPTESIKGKISPEGEKLLKLFNGNLFGNFDVLFSDISLRLGSSIDNPYSAIKLSSDEQGRLLFQQELKVKELFTNVFNDKEENSIWFIKLLNKLGVSRDALQQSFYILGKRSVNEVNRLSTLQKEVGQAFFNMGKYRRAGKWFKKAEQTAKKTNVPFFFIFNLKTDYLESIRCQRKYYTYIIFLAQLELYFYYHRFLGKCREDLKKGNEPLENRCPELDNRVSYYQQVDGPLKKEKYLYPIQAALFQRESQLIELFYQKGKLFKILKRPLVSLLGKAKDAYEGYGDLMGIRDIEYRLYKLGIGNRQRFNFSSIEERKAEDIDPELTVGYERVGNTIGKINVLVEQAKRYLNFDDYSNAEKTVREGVHLGEAIGAFPECAKGYGILSRILGKQSRNEEAQKALAKAYYYIHELEIKHIEKPDKLSDLLERFTLD